MLFIYPCSHAILFKQFNCAAAFVNQAVVRISTYPHHIVVRTISNPHHIVVRTISNPHHIVVRISTSLLLYPRTMFSCPTMRMFCYLGVFAHNVPFIKRIAFLMRFFTPIFTVVINRFLDFFQMFSHIVFNIWIDLDFWWVEGAIYTFDPISQLTHSALDSCIKSNQIQNITLFSDGNTKLEYVAKNSKLEYFVAMHNI